MSQEKRSEYLKSLNKMRAGYQNAGNPMINPDDDSTNPGNELSSFAYMNTDIPSPESSEEKGPERNGWQRFAETAVGDIGRSAATGVLNFLDDAWDFVVSIASWVSGLGSGIASAANGNGFEQGWKNGTDWAKPLIQYDWVDQANAFINQISITSALTGEMFDGEKWAAISSPESAKKYMEDKEKTSFRSDWGDFGKVAKKVEEGIGYYLPSIALAVLTHGQSLGVQAAIQGGVSFGTAYGSSVETALDEGADYNKAMGYAAVKGAIAGATTAATVGIGGSIYNKVGTSGVASKVGDAMAKAVGKATTNATVQHAAGIVGETITKAGISAAEAAGKTALEPVLKSIYDDGKAIDYAYNQGHITEQMRDSAIQAAVTTAIINIGREGMNYASSEGKGNAKTESWNRKYFDSMAYRTALGKATREAKSINDKYSKLLGEDINKLLKGKIKAEDVNLNDPKYQRIFKDYAKEIDDWSNRYSDLVRDSLSALPKNEYTEEYRKVIYNRPGQPKLIGKEGGESQKFSELKESAEATAKQKLLNFMTGAKKAQNDAELKGVTPKEFWSAFKEATDKAIARGKARGNAIDGEWSEKQWTTDGPFEFRTNKNTKINIKLVSHNKVEAISLKTPDEIVEATKFLSQGQNTVSEIDTKIKFDAKAFNIPYVAKKGASTETTMTAGKGIVDKIANDKDLSVSLAKVDYDKTFIIDNGDGTMSAIEPVKDDNKKIVVKVDKKTNEVKDIGFGEIPTKTRFFVIPKRNAKKIMETKLENPDGTAKLYSMADGSLEPDIEMGEGGAAFNVLEAANRAEDDTVFIYSKNPLKESDAATALAFDMVSKKFKIPESLRKTYVNKMMEGTMSLLKYLASRDGISVGKVIKKLGFDSFVRDDGSVTVFDYSNIIDKGVEYTYGKKTKDSDGDIVKRIASDNIRKQLEGYLSGNGKELEGNADRESYSGLVKQNLAYVERKEIIDGEEHTIKVVESQAYTPEMKQIDGMFGKIGIKTIFALNDEEGTGIGGMTMEDGKSVLLVIDFRNEKTSFFSVAKHELGHVILNKLHGWTLLNLRKRLDSYPDQKEITSLRKRYGRLYKGAVGYNEEDYDEEILANLYAGIEKLKDTEWQINLQEDMDELYVKGPRKADRENAKILSDEERAIEEETYSNLYLKDSSKSDYDTEFVAHDGFETMEASISIKYNKETGRFDVIATDKYTNQTMPTKSFKRKKSAVRYVKDVYGEKNLKRLSATKEEESKTVPASTETVTKPMAAEKANVAKTPAEKKNELPAEAQSRKKNTPAPKKQERKNLPESEPVQAPQPSAQAQTPTESQSQGQAPANGEVAKKPLVTEKEKNSAAKLIEAGADVKRDVKVRLKDVKDAFVAAINGILPQTGGTSFTVHSNDYRTSFAEYDLTDPKKADEVFSNMVDHLKNADITIAGADGEEKVKLGQLMTDEQANTAMSIIRETINGKAQPTKLAQWAESLNLEKLKGKENIETMKRINSLNKKIANGSKDYLSAPGNPPIELGLYGKLIDGVKGPFSTASLKKLVENIKTYYNEDNFGQMLTAYGLGLNDTVIALADVLSNSFQSGRGLNAQQIDFGNFILESLQHEMGDLSQGIRNKNYEETRDTVSLAQAALGEAKAEDGLVSKVKNAAASIDQSIRSPISVLENVLGEENPFIDFLTNGGKDCENEQKLRYAEFRDAIIGEKALNDAGFKNVGDLVKELSPKVDFKGHKITIGQALKILNTQKTAKSQDYFLSRGGSLTVGGKRVDILDITKEDMDDLQSDIPERVKKWNDDYVLKLLNGDMRDYIEKRFHDMSGVSLKMEGLYYPTSAVGDKAPDILGARNGSINPSDWGLSFFKERASHTNAPYNFDGDVASDVIKYIGSTTRWGAWAPWYKKFKTLLNTPVYGRGTTLNAILGKNVVGWPELRDFMQRTVLGVPYDSSTGMLQTIDKAVGGLFGNLQQVAMMDPFTQLKTLGSDFTGWQYFGIANAIKGLERYWSMGGPAVEKKAREIIERYSPSLAQRFDSMEAFNANLAKAAKGKFTKMWTTPVRALDMHIHLKAYYMCEEKVRKELGPNATEEQIQKAAVRELEKYSDTTQPTTSTFRVGMYRAGAKGQIVKQVFGMFQSMGQNIYQGLYDVTFGFSNAKRRIANYEASSLEHEKKAMEYAAKEDEARKKAEEAKAKAEEARRRDDQHKAEEAEKEREKAEKMAEEAKFHKEGHERSKKTVDEAMSKAKAKLTGKHMANKAAGYVAGLIGSGLALTLISKIKKKAYGQEEWNDWDADELTQEAAYQSFVNWIPFIGTLANSIKNDSDLTVFTIDNLNTFVQAGKEMISAFGSGDGKKSIGRALRFVTLAAQFFGIPAQSMWKIINGVWYNVDKESNISFKESMGLLSSNSIRSNYNDAVSKGQKDKAIANMDVWMGVYSTGTDKAVSEEIYRLNRLGIKGVTPGAYPTSYTDDSGEKVYMSSSQISDYREMFRKSGEQASSLVGNAVYQQLDDEYKGRALKAIWSAYSQAAKQVSYDKQATGKAAQLLAMTNGDIELAKYIAGLQKLSGKKSAEVIKEANKLSGYSRIDKLVVLWLNGNKLTDANKNLLAAWLRGKGATAEDAKKLFA